MYIVMYIYFGEGEGGGREWRGGGGGGGDIISEKVLGKFCKTVLKMKDIKSEDLDVALDLTPYRISKSGFLPLSRSYLSCRVVVTIELCMW